MKRPCYSLWVVTSLFLSASAYAGHGMIFSTNLNAAEDYAWQLYWTSGYWTMSFPDDAIIVDSSDPLDPVLKGDLVRLPDFSLTNISSTGLVTTATITPQGPLTIVDDVGGGTVLTAMLPADGMVAVGRNFIACGPAGDDVHIAGFLPRYGVVIPGLVSDQSYGLPVNLSFSGNNPNRDLSLLLLGRGGIAQGGLSGQTHSVGTPVVPLPGAWLLA